MYPTVLLMREPRQERFAFLNKVHPTIYQRKLHHAEQCSVHIESFRAGGWQSGSQSRMAFQFEELPPGNVCDKVVERIVDYGRAAKC